MIIHNDPLFALYFADARTAFDPALFRNSSSSILLQKPFVHIAKSADLQELVFLHQVHGANGLVLTSHEHAKQVAPFVHEGDFLLTNIPHIGIGIATADCLVIGMFDSFNRAIALVHAGWRGSVAGVAGAALKRMSETFGTRAQDVRIFFGPSAKACCYVVGDEVLAALDQFSCKDEVLHTANGNVYFDMPLFNRLLLEEHGVRRELCKLNYNMCTICDTSFCSYRRNKASLDRQMTVLILK